jgi:hypothetical protein
VYLVNALCLFSDSSELVGDLHSRDAPVAVFRVTAYHLEPKTQEQVQHISSLVFFLQSLTDNGTLFADGRSMEAVLGSV